MKKICFFVMLLVCGLSVSAFAGNTGTQYETDSLDWKALKDAQTTYMVDADSAGARDFIKGRLSADAGGLFVSALQAPSRSEKLRTVLAEYCPACDPRELRLIKNYLAVEGRIVLSIDEKMLAPETPQQGVSNEDVIREIQKTNSSLDRSMGVLGLIILLAWAFRRFSISR